MESQPDKKPHEDDDTLKALEQDAAKQEKTSRETQAEKKSVERWDTNIKKPEATSRLRKGTWVMSMIVAIVALMGVAGMILLSPSLLLVNMKEQLTNDLNDAMGVYHNFAHKVLAMQVNGDSCEEEKIQCKFGTMSNMLKKRFEDYKVEPSAGEKNERGRFAVSSLKIPKGETLSDGKKIKEATQKNDKTRYYIDNVLNPKNGLFHDRKFPDRLHERFHIEHRPMVRGYNAKDIGTSFGDALKRQGDYIDDNGNGVYGLHYLLTDEGKKQWKEKVRDRLLDNAKPTHQLLACSIYTYGEMSENVVRRAKSVTLARFAMQYMALADSIKSGNSSSYEMTLNNLTDRLTVGNDEGKNALDGSSYRIPARLEEADNGALKKRDRNYMNDPKAMLTALRNNGIGPDSPGTQYLREVMDSIDTGEDDIYKACVKGLSSEQESTERSKFCGYEYAELLAGYISVAAGGKFTLKKLNAKEPCETPLSAIVTEVRDEIRDTVSKLIADKINQSVKTEADYFTYLAAGIETQETAKLGVGTATQDAIFAGTGIILGDVAQSLGMRPATKSTIGEYYKQLAQQGLLPSQREVPSQDTKLRRFVATIARTVYGTDTLSARLPNLSLQNVLASTFTIGSRALASMNDTTVSAVYSQPMNLSQKRFLSMEDCSLEGDFIDPDFGCNIRYSMSKEAMNADIKEVLDYMVEAHPDDAKESLEQINKRNTSADSEAGDRMKNEAQQGSEATYIDPKTGKPNPHTQYAKFLEFCVNRTNPWGSMGVVTEYQEEEYTPDEPDPIGEENLPVYSGEYLKYMDRKHGEEIDKDGNVKQTEPKDPPYMYYARAWGSEVDQKWMTGEKCVEESEMMKNFRAYTAACRVLAGLSGARECWHDDSNPTFHTGFYPRNDIIFVREN